MINCRNQAVTLTLRSFMGTRHDRDHRIMRLVRNTFAANVFPIGSSVARFFTFRGQARAKIPAIYPQISITKMQHLQ